MSWWTTNNKLHPKVKNKFIVVFGSTFYIPSVKSLNKPKVTFETKEFRLINHKFNYPGNATWEPITIKFVDMNGNTNPTDSTEFFDTAAFLWQVMNNTGYRYPYINTSNYKDPVFKSGTGGTTGHWVGTKIDTKKPGGYRYITTPEKSSTVANSFGSGLSSVRDTKAASSAKQRISIYQIDPDGYTVELWHLVNPIVKSISWGDLDYSADDLVEYELQVAYDWAILDREGMGKEPEYSGVDYREFMKTIYKTNQLEVEAALRKRIEELKENDEILDNRVEAQKNRLERLQENLEDATFGSEEYDTILEAMELLSGDADELAGERAALLKQQEDILEEAEELYGEDFSRALEEEFTNELNLTDDLDEAVDFFNESSDVYIATEENLAQYEEDLKREEEARQRQEETEYIASGQQFLDATGPNREEESEYPELKGVDQSETVEGLFMNDEGKLVTKEELVNELENELDVLYEQDQGIFSFFGRSERDEKIEEIEEKLDRLSPDTTEDQSTGEIVETPSEPIQVSPTSGDTSLGSTHEEQMEYFESAGQQTNEIAEGLGFSTVMSLSLDELTGEGTITGMKDGEITTQNFTIKTEQE